MATATVPEPTITRQGRVLIPSAWSVLAIGVLADDDNTAARELARLVLDAADPAVKA